MDEWDRKAAEGHYPAGFADVLRNRAKRIAAGAGRIRKTKKAPVEYFPVHGKADYARYLRTKHWKKVRAKAAKRAGGRCAVCGVAVSRPQVHHRHYKRLWRERPGDLVVLCRTHHETHHLGVSGLELQHLKACAAGE